MRNKFLQFSLPGRKALYAMTLAMLFMTAAGFYMLAPATATVVEAQKAGTTDLITSDLPPRPDRLAIALDFRSAHNLAIFGGKGIDDAGGTTFRGAVPSRNETHSHGDAASSDDRGRALGDLERTRNIINQLPCTTIADGDLTGKAFGPGVYCLPSMRLAGQLTLDGIGDTKATFVFVVKGSLNAERGSSFTLQNGAAAQNVYFVADDKATVAGGVVFGGTILARNEVTLGTRADVKGRALSVQGKLSVGSEAAAGGGTGILEICKQEEVRNQDEDPEGGGNGTPLGDRIFRFQIGADIYFAQVGFCTGPIELATGNVVITELDSGPLVGGGTWSGRFRLVDVNSPTPGALGTVNLPARTANVFIREGGINNLTVVNFVNTFAITAVIEICKRAVLRTTSIGTNALYGVQPATGRIVRVNPDTGAVTTVGNAPAGLLAAHTQIGLSGAENGASLIYVNSNVNAAQIFRLNPANAAILSTESANGFTLDGLSAQTAGNTNFIFQSHDSTDIHRQVGFSGGEQFFWSNITPQGGLGGDDLGREFAFTTAGDIREYDPFNDNNSINTIPSPAANIEGLAFDGNFLYATSATGTIYTLNPNTGAVLDSAAVTGGALFGLGAINVPSVNDVDVTGFFDFTVDAIANTVFPVPVGQCTPGITVNVPTDPGPVPQDSIVRVSELAEPGFQFEDATTFPVNRFISLTFNRRISGSIACSTIGDNSPVPPACVLNNPGGGYVTAFVIEGGVSNQTTFNFFNRTRPGRVKICKVAGPGIPIGTIFRFRVIGLGPSNPFPGAIMPGLPSDQFVDVSAGPANQGGFCSFADGTFIIGSAVFVSEVGWLTPIPGVPPGDVRISRLRFMGFVVDFDQTTLTLLLSPPPAGSSGFVGFTARRETVEIEYTDIVFRPTVLKICKEAGTGVAPGTLFTFTVVIDSEGGVFSPASIAVPNVTVPAGSCAFAQGPYTPTATNPPVGTFRVGSRVYVTEAAAAGTVLTSIASPTGPVIACDPANPRCGGLVMAHPGGFNEIIFRNQAASVAAPFDFDGDGRTDISVTRPSGSSTWYQLVGQNYNFVEFNLGQNGDVVVPADYDGDGKTQAGVFRPSTGDWWVMTAGEAIENAVNAGAAGDIPLPSDYTGDGKADFVLFRPSTSQWLRFENGSTNTAHFFFGTSGDKPLVGDFDGDGKADLAVFRPSTGTFWYAASSAGNAFRPTQWGTSGDVPAVADFDGDGKTDYAVFRPSTGIWYIMNSSNGSTTGLQWGTAGDRPLAGDFDGDGRADVAVFRPSNGTWYIIKSGSGYLGFAWGISTDIATPSAYVP